MPSQTFPPLELPPMTSTNAAPHQHSALLLRILTFRLNYPSLPNCLIGTSLSLRYSGNCTVSPITLGVHPLSPPLVSNNQLDLPPCVTACHCSHRSPEGIDPPCPHSSSPRSLELLRPRVSPIIASPSSTSHHRNHCPPMWRRERFHPPLPGT